MQPQINAITLAVTDLEKSVAFYRDGLGFPTKGIVGTEFKGSSTEAAGAVCFFELGGGLLLALYPKSELAKDADIPFAPGTSSLEFSIGYFAESEDAVDRILTLAETAGATVKAARTRPWGIYSGYFADLDGHLWEIIWSDRTHSA